MTETSNSEIVLTRQRRIAELARQSPQMGFTSLNQYLDMPWMYEAYRRTRKDGAAGVDGQTAAAYEENLRANLQDLLNRAKSGTYRAPPVRRVHIPKGGSRTETRPIGIPTFEDKVLQRAIVMVLEAIYEQDFMASSYGFRPKRSAHQALESLWQQTMRMGGGWVLDVDIRKFFDTLDRARLRGLLRLRVRDGVLLRLIGKWLNAGVMEDGLVTHPDAGTPQGGVVSPVLSNVYLHYVLDKWFEEDVKPRLHGHAWLIRFADDFVIGFSCEADAHRVMKVLPKRFGKYGLTIHPDKTRLVPFRRPDRFPTESSRRRDPAPGTFDLLGFTHYWGISRKGNWVVRRKTAKNRLARAIRTVALWCRSRRHRPIAEQHHTLSQKMRGHFAYYGLAGNGSALSSYRTEVRRAWGKWLARRKRGDRHSWTRYARLLDRYPLPAVAFRATAYQREANP